MPVSPTSQRALATLLDMTHDARPGARRRADRAARSAAGRDRGRLHVGGGGHARLVADRIGPNGTLIGIDRDPTAEERFAELAAEVTCETRFIRADFVSALEQLREERVERRPRLPRPRDVLDAGRHLGARLLLLVRRAAGHADGPRPGADRAGDRQQLGRAAAGAAVPRVRRGALRDPDRARDRARAPAR